MSMSTHVVGLQQLLTTGQKVRIRPGWQSCRLAVGSVAHVVHVTRSGMVVLGFPAKCPRCGKPHSPVTLASSWLEPDNPKEAKNG
jgi:hypothetical protein